MNNYENPTMHDHTTSDHASRTENEQSRTASNTGEQSDDEPTRAAWLEAGALIFAGYAGISYAVSDAMLFTAATTIAALVCLIGADVYQRGGGL